MRAHWRPSLIAHTISDWPRRASPAAKTPSTEVVYGLTALTLPRAVAFHAELVEQPLLGVQEAHRQQHELRRQLAARCPATGANGGSGAAPAHRQRLAPGPRCR